jgi:hypothetical protein
MLTYTPEPGISGPVTFVYALSDGKGGTDTATVTINVIDGNNNPPVALDDSASTTDGVPGMCFLNISLVSLCCF